MFICGPVLTEGSLHWELLHFFMIPTLKHKQKCQKIIKKPEFWKKWRDLETASDQISLIIFHLGCADQVILLSSPVPKTTKKVIGEETVNRIPDDVYVDRLFYPKSEKERDKLSTELFTNVWLHFYLGLIRYIQIHNSWLAYLVKLRKWTCLVYRKGCGIVLMFLIKSTWQKINTNKQIKMHVT